MSPLETPFGFRGSSSAIAVSLVSSYTSRELEFIGGGLCHTKTELTERVVIGDRGTVSRILGDE